MPQFLKELFANQFIPHGACLRWTPDILWTHVTSDLVIALSYFLIPLALFQIVKRRSDLLFNWMFILFSLFILSCGLTHVMAIVVLWNPVYRLEGVVKLVTALASFPTALLLTRLVPQVASLPSVQQYRDAQAQLESANAGLEERVAQRTQELAEVNQRLEATHTELVASEQQYRTLAESLPNLVWTADATGTISYLNQQWMDYTGLSFEQARSGEWIQTVHPDDREACGQAWQRAVETGGLYELQHRQLDARSQEYRWHLTRAVPLRGPSGQVLRWFGSTTDIHATKTAEEERAQLLERVVQAQALLDSVFDNAPVGFALWTTDLRFVRVNDDMAQTTGLPRDEHAGKTLEEVLPTLERVVRPVLQSVLETGKPLKEVELDGETPTFPGVVRSWLCSFFPVHAPGIPLQIASVWRDITPRKVAERGLRESERAFRTLAEAVPQIVWSTRPDGSVEYFNQRWYEYTGTDPKAQQENEWMQRLHPDDREPTSKIWSESLSSGTFYEVQYRLREAATQRYRWFMARGLPLMNERGQVTRWFGTCTDIHDQKCALEKLERVNKDLEDFAYAASHDLQEPLRSVLLYGQLIQQRHAGTLTPVVASAVDSMVKGANRLATLLVDLRSLLRSSLSPPDSLPPVAINDVLCEVLENLTAAVEESGALITSEPFPELHADRYHLVQIFQNLLSNAIKYRGSEAPRVRIYCDVKRPEWVFTVEDNGPGVDPGHQERIFAPFQRLHGQRIAGTGLGLAICARIVQHYQGRIWVDSEVGRGSSFRFTLPLAQYEYSYQRSA